MAYQNFNTNLCLSIIIMIHLYFKALRAKSVEEIVDIAQKEHDYLIHNNINSISPYFQLDFKYYTAFVESTSILKQASFRKNSVNVLDTTFAFIVNPLITFFKGETKEARLHCFCSGILQSIPWSKFIDIALTGRFNMYSKYSDLIVLECGSLYQAVLKVVERQNKSILRQLFQLILANIEFFTINYCAFNLSKYIEKNTAIPSFIIQILINLLFTTPLTRHFSSKGFKSLCYTLFFSLINKKPNTVDFELPDDCEIPNELKCLICYDLLNDPVQCQGQVMCKSCLQRWADSSHGFQNPITGRDYSPDEVSKEYVFDVLSKQFLKCIQNSNKMCLSIK